MSATTCRNWLLFCCYLLMTIGCGEPTASCCSGDATPAAAAEPTTIQPTGAPSAGMSIYQLDHQFVDATGKQHHLADFAGKPVLMAMVFTHCQYACPALIADLQRIVADATVSRDLHVVLLSMDVARDDPATLRAFATTHQLDGERYTLLHGEQSAVEEVAAVLGVRIAPVANGDFSHSNQIALLDRHGVVHFRLPGLGVDAAPLKNSLAELAAD